MRNLGITGVGVEWFLFEVDWSWFLEFLFEVQRVHRVSRVSRVTKLVVIVEVLRDCLVCEVLIDVLVDHRWLVV